MKFSEFIRDLRLRKKFSQAWLADFFGLHYKTIAAWERGLQNPNSIQLRKVSLRTGESFIKLWVMAHHNSPFIVPVFSIGDLKNARDKIPAPTRDEKAFWIIVDKKVEVQTKSFFKNGEMLLVEPSQIITSGDLILHNGKIKKAGPKSKGFKISFRLTPL